MANIRPCRQCGKLVDFSEPWCDHETMEESAWIDINKRFNESVIDDAVKIAEKELRELNGK